jgi:hypothetical protein
VILKQSSFSATVELMEHHSPVRSLHRNFHPDEQGGFFIEEINP